LSVSRLAAAVRARELSATNVVEALVAQIHRLDGQLGSYLRVDAAGALEAARQVDARIARGEDPGPLAGVPVGIKDMIVTAGLETTCASKILAGWVPPRSYDATVVRRLREAGAIILGKLNMDEFAMGSSNENSAVRPVHNPWDPTRVPGGSSGGSAAAVAAGLATISLGTDTGGSIRQPAALCGVVGLKPTYGRVSRYGIVAFASSLDQCGPFGRTVEDVAAALEVIAGHDPLDSTSLEAPVGRYREACRLGATDGVKGLRVGIPREYFQQGLDPAIEASVRTAIATLWERGAVPVEVSLPHTEYALAVYYLIAPAEASSNLARYDGVRFGHRAEGAGSLLQMYCKSRAEGFGPEVRRRILLGTYALRSGYYDAYYKKAQQVRTLIREDFTRVFEVCDVIATPTSPVGAFKLGERSKDPVQMYLSDIYTLSCNLAGLPGISVPCGLLPADDGARLPVGLQLLGRPLGEEELLRAAAAYEAATDWHRQRPPLFAELGAVAPGRSGLVTAGGAA
jgi:aspartyl-tRNA(Asn)/glutamyl-tRNA(Gln) amidotransferase subunit A